MKAITSIARAEFGKAAGIERLRPWLDLRYVALLTTLGTYALIVLGGTVRVTGSGLACPDWPLCHGELIPPAEKKVMIEYAHRLVASVIGLFILATFLAAWMTRAENRAAFRGTLAAGVLLIVQVGLGGITVLSNNHATSVVVHLSVALSLLAALIFVTAVAFRPLTDPVAFRPHHNPRLSTYRFPVTAALAAAALFAVIVTGSYVANTGAALVYPDWPLFDGSVFSAGGKLANLHYAHRLVAAASGFLVLAVAIEAWRLRPREAIILAAVIAVMVLYIAQVFIGASNIWFSLASSVRIAHLAIASAAWATLVFLSIWAYLGQARQANGRNDA